MSGTQKQKFSAFLARNTRYLTLAGIVLAMSVIFGLLNPKFYGFSNLMNIVRQTSIIAILSIGMTFVILTGGIDLSVGSNIALSGAVAVVVLQATNSAVLSFLAAIATGAVVGLINGVLIGKLRISAFIATLAMLTAARGATMLVTNAGAIRIENEAYRFVAQGDLFGVVPFLLVLVIVFYAIFIGFSSKYVFGRQTYAVGGNMTAARAMGINVEKHIILVYVLAGALAGVAAIITVGRVSSAQPWAGLNVEFDVITAVVLGGTSLLGGIGTMLGTLFGALLMGVISNGMGLVNVDPYLEYIIKGLLVLVAVYVDLMLFRMREKRLTPAVERAENAAQEDPKTLRAISEGGKRHLLTMQSITKSFPGMKALDNVSLTVQPGEILALLGENGAGKSTLMKILAGEERMSAGEIRIDGDYIDIHSPQKAAAVGIAMIHQEFSHVRELTVAQNIFLGREIKSAVPGFVSKHKMEQAARKLLQSLDCSIDPRKPIKELTVSEQQMVEIAKALSKNAWMLILDEPTSSLTEEEKGFLFATMRRLKEQGVSMIYISHRMQEIFEIADSVTILRDGKLVDAGPVSNYSEADIIRLMVGRELVNIFSREKCEIGAPILEVRELYRDGVFEPVSFTVHSGEVLGFSGLMGAGRTEIARCIFGLDRADGGDVLIDGKKLRIRSTQDAIENGIMYVTEDRRLEGFVPYMSIKTNLCMPSYPRIHKLGRVRRGEEQTISAKYIKDLRIKTTSQDKNVMELSGGNQQKVSLGKWLALGPKVLILDEPTRGIDVGAKAEIHGIIEEAAKNGMAVILISSELPELIGCVDRLMVLHAGKVTGVLNAAELTQDRIMEMAVAAEECDGSND